MSVAHAGCAVLGWLAVVAAAAAVVAAGRSKREQTHGSVLKLAAAGRTHTRLCRCILASRLCVCVCGFRKFAKCYLRTCEPFGRTPNVNAHTRTTYERMDVCTSNHVERFTSIMIVIIIVIILNKRRRACADEWRTLIDGSKQSSEPSSLYALVLCDWITVCRHNACGWHI